MENILHRLASLLLLAVSIGGCTPAPYLPPNPCRIAPVRGFEFQTCENTTLRSDRGVISRHSLEYSDDQSELLLLYFRSEGGAVKGFPPEATVEFFRSPEAFGAYFGPVVDIGSVRVDRGERFFDFNLGGRRCKGYVRFGKQVQAGANPEYEGLAALMMCRRSTVPLSITEVRFFTDQLKFY